MAFHHQHEFWKRILQQTGELSGPRRSKHCTVTFTGAQPTANPRHLPLHLPQSPFQACSPAWPCPTPVPLGRRRKVCIHSTEWPRLPHQQWFLWNVWSQCARFCFTVVVSMKITNISVLNCTANAGVISPLQFCSLQMFPCTSVLH